MLQSLGQTWSCDRCFIIILSRPEFSDVKPTGVCPSLSESVFTHFIAYIPSHCHTPTSDQRRQETGCGPNFTTSIFIPFTAKSYLMGFPSSGFPFVMKLKVGCRVSGLYPGTCNALVFASTLFSWGRRISTCQVAVRKTQPLHTRETAFLVCQSGVILCDFLCRNIRCFHLISPYSSSC